MKTILKDNNETPQMLIGRCVDWPDGLYNYRSFYIAVYSDSAMRWCEGSGHPESITFTSAAYKRVPGYTGRIAAITPEAE